MAKKTKAADLSIEEKLEQALVVPGYEPYKIPDNWCWVRVDSICKVFTGNSINERVKAEKYMGRTNGLIYLATKDIGFDSIIDYNTNVCIPKDEGFKIAPKGSSLLCIEGGSAGRKIGIVNQDVCFVNKLCAFVPNRIIIPLYLFWAIQSEAFKSQFDAKKHGLIGGVSLKEVSSIYIPLSPVQHQLKIVERIESLFSKLDEAKEKAQEVIDSFETRKAAILHKAFSGELTAKWREENGVGIESWESTKIGNMLTEIKYGTSEKSDYSFDGIPVFRIPNIGDMTLIFDDVKKIQRQECSENEYLSENDILIIRSNGSKELVGKCALVPKINFKCTYASFLIRLRMKDSISSLYTVWYLTSEQARKQLFNKAKSSAGIHNINSKEISDISIVVPSKPEQNIITATLERLITKEKETVIFAESVIDQIDTMKKAILARAFRGELGTNDPEEESGKDLLREIFLSNTDNKIKRPRIVIPEEIASLLNTELERKIIRLFLKSDTGEVTAEEIMALSSKKVELIDLINALKEKKLIKQINNNSFILLR